MKSLAILLVFFCGVKSSANFTPGFNGGMRTDDIGNTTDGGSLSGTRLGSTFDYQTAMLMAQPEVCGPNVKFAGVYFPSHDMSARCYPTREAALADCQNGYVKDLSSSMYEVDGMVPPGKNFYCLRPDPALPNSIGHQRREFSNQSACEVGIRNVGNNFRWVSGGDYTVNSIEEVGHCECRPAFTLNSVSSNEDYRICNTTDEMQAALNPPQKTATVAASPQTQPKTTTTQPADAQNTTPQSFSECINEAKNQASLCTSRSDDTSRRCNVTSSSAQNSNTLNATSGMAGSLANAYVGANAGTGSQSSCFNAGLLSNATRITAEMTNDSCKSSVESCQSICTESAYDDYRVKCASLVTLPNGQAFTPEALESNSSGAFATQSQQFRDMSTEIQPKFADGRTKCQTQGSDKLGSLDQMLGGVGSALQGSLRCACQLASGCSTQNIPLAQDCVSNPSLAGCQVYSEMSVCTPGATYNAALCRCQTNPSAGGCSGVKTTGALASMASGLIQTNSGGTSSFATAPTATPSSGAANHLDLSGGTGSSGISLDATAKSGAGGSRQPYVGGGVGDGGGGVAPQARNAAGVEGEKDGILSGFMNAIKTGARALGFSRSPNNGGYKGGGYSSTSTKTFAPRGLAGGRSGIGSRNMEIWTMMNKCIQADTCPSNSGQFIPGP